MQRVKQLKIHNHSNKTINFTFFSKKGLCNSGLKAKVLPLHTIISNNTFKVTICDLKNKDRNMADNIEHQDKGELVTNCDRFNSLKHSTVRSYAFTEQGVAMLSTVLRSENRNSCKHTYTPDELVERINRE